MSRLVPLKCVVQYNRETLADSHASDDVIRYIEIGDVNETEGVTGTTEMPFGDAPSRARRVVRHGDVLISTVRTYLRAVGGITAELDGAVASTGFATLTPKGVHSRYLQYAVLEQTFLDDLEARSTGVSYPAINSSDLVRIPIRVPAVAEQRAIADYLDRETAQIDEFIAENERFIGLLVERRAAVIAHAATKGLDPDAPMRDSGVEWLGEVPEGWEVGNIRRFAAMRTGHTPSRQRPEYWRDCDTGWFTLADVWQLREGRKYLGETTERVSKVGIRNSAAELLPAGTVVLSRTASVGFAGIMPEPMATSQDFWNWVPGNKLVPEYLWYQFLAMKPDFERLMMGSTHNTIYKSDAASIVIAVPPVEEQRVIAGYLDERTARIDEAIATASEGITLAKERRSALISAAVTGKIDVTEGAA